MRRSRELRLIATSAASGRSAWRRWGIATQLSQARLCWAFARTDKMFYVTRADNVASLLLHAAFGFQEMKRFRSEQFHRWCAVAAREDGGKKLTASDRNRT